MRNCLTVRQINSLTRFSMSLKKPVPPHRAGHERVKCPFCGLPSYSASGAHPQCVQRSNDRMVDKAAAALALVTPP